MSYQLASGDMQRGRKAFTDGLAFAWMLAKRDLKNRYASSYAGAAWHVGVPLIYMSINVLVFSILMTGRMGERYGDIPFALFYFVPFSLWTVFAEVLARSTGILKEYGYLINKIAFPFWVLPLVTLSSALLSQFIVFVLIIGLMLFKGIAPAGTVWVFAVIWLLSLLITIGMAYAVSAVSVYVPDMVQLVPLCITILFWLTPVLYPAAMVSQHAAAWVRNIIMDYNPFYYLVESARLAVFGVTEFPWGYVGIVGAVAVLAMAGGFFVFRKLQPGFADVV
jgi:lipopolysaccharide transport system permease protein